MQNNAPEWTCARDFKGKSRNLRNIAEMGFIRENGI